MTNPTVVVLGGNGFVGTEIAKQLVTKNYTPLCISRSGEKPVFLEAEPWSDQADWCYANDEEKIAASFRTAEALICLVGSPPVPTFSKSAYQRQLVQNSQPNLSAIARAEAGNLDQIVLLGAHLPRALHTDRFAYARGKRLCLEAAKSFAASSETRGAAVLQPTGIFGIRHTADGKALNLSACMRPISKLQGVAPEALKQFLPEQLVSVESVAKMAISAALEPDYRGKFSVISNPEIAALMD